MKAENHGGVGKGLPFDHATGFCFCHNLSHVVIHFMLSHDALVGPWLISILFILNPLFSYIFVFKCSFFHVQRLDGGMGQDSSSLADRIASRSLSAGAHSGLLLSGAPWIFGNKHVSTAHVHVPNLEPANRLK